MLEEEEETGREPNHADLEMRQAIKFMMNTFQTLKVCEFLTKATTSEAWQTAAEDSNERTSLTASMPDALMTPATNTMAAGGTLRVAAITTTPAGAASARGRVTIPHPSG